MPRGGRNRRRQQAAEDGASEGSSRSASQPPAAVPVSPQSTDNSSASVEPQQHTSSTPSTPKTPSASDRSVVEVAELKGLSSPAESTIPTVSVPSTPPLQDEAACGGACAHMQKALELLVVVRAVVLAVAVWAAVTALCAHRWAEARFPEYMKRARALWLSAEPQVLRLWQQALGLAETHVVPRVRALDERVAHGAVERNVHSAVADWQREFAVSRAEMQV